LGYHSTIHLPKPENILAISYYLNSIDCQILNKDYQELLPLVKEQESLFVASPYAGSLSTFYATKRLEQTK